VTLEALLATLFPPTVVVEAAGPDDADESQLTREESAWLPPMAPIRRREFTLGRNAARHALRRLGIPAATIGRHPEDRDPVWPAGVVGSISHSHGVAAAACAPADRVLGIGLDLERAGPLGDDLVAEICRPDELAHLRELAPHPVDWPKQLFTIKEAAYKAWFPRTRTPLEFHAMRVSLDPVTRCFSASVQHAATARLGEAPWVLEGRFGWNEEVLVAGAVLHRTD